MSDKPAKVDEVELDLDRVAPKKPARRGRPAGGKQPTAVERADYVMQVQRHMAAGWSAAEVVKWLTTKITKAMSEETGLPEKKWAVSKPTARQYIRLAWRGWFEEDRADENHERTRHRRRFLHIYQRALASGELHVALKAEEKLAQMDGAFAPAPPPPEDYVDDMSEEEALDALEDDIAYVDLMRKRGHLVVSPEQAATAIDVAPAREPVPVVDEVGLVPRPPGGN